MYIAPMAKQERINLRLSTADRLLFDKAARSHEESLSEFMAESGRERAERLLADRTTFPVDADRFRELLALLDRPAQLKPELVELFDRPRPE